MSPDQEREARRKAREAEIKARTEAEMMKGASLVVHDALAQRFDPDYKVPARPDTVGGMPFDKWRASQDAYIARMRAGRGEK